MTKVELKSNIDQLVKEIEIAQKRALTIASEFVQGEAVLNLNKNIDTGNLAQKIDYWIQGNSAVVGTNVKYAPYIEFGTGIYAEDGQGRKTPWFYKYEGNKRPRGWYITRGMKPTKFLRSALNDNAEKIRILIRSEMAKAVNKV